MSLSGRDVGRERKKKKKGERKKKKRKKEEKGKKGRERDRVEEAVDGCEVDGRG